MARKPKESRTRLVAIEVSRSTLQVVIVERMGANRPADVRTRSIPWRRESKSLHTDAGIAELTAALKTLVAEEKLTGKRVRMTLNGDFCVTRVLTGTNDEVRRELSELEDRSGRYLSLGPGRKALAGSIRQVDARHQHALLTVSNQKTLDALVHVAATVGIHIELIEPSLVALSRVLGKLGHDHSDPVLLVTVDERGVELGISYQGQLLLDYRPGGHAIHANIVDIVVQHLARLKRYCYRYFRFAKGNLERLYLCGASEYADQVYRGFASHPELSVAPLDLTEIDETWRFSTPPTSDFAPAIGTCLLPAGGEELASSPNLMKDISDHTREPLVREAIRALWPVAAVLVLCASMLFVMYVDRQSIRALEADLAAFEHTKAKTRDLRLTLASTEGKRKNLLKIRSQLAAPPLDALLGSLGECLPDDTWLDKLQLRSDGQIDMTGTSFTEDSVYQFLDALKLAPLLTKVALGGTRSGNFGGRPVINFEIQCELGGYYDSPESEDHDD